MNKRPIAVTILSWLYILVGVLSTAAHFMQFRSEKPAVNEVVWVTVLGVTAIAAGAFMLGAKSWARWLALAWIAAHVVISAMHPHLDLAVHSVLLIAFAYILFRPEARAFFSAA
jgi:hypothetical protein